MSGTFRNLRITNLLAVSLAVMMVHKADGYPYQWQDFFSHSETKVPSARGGVSLGRGNRVSISKDYRREIEVSDVAVPYEHFSWDDNDKNGNPIVNEGSVRRWAQNSEDDEDDNEDEDKSEDAIAQTVKQALVDKVFLTPEKWSETLVDMPLEIPDDEARIVKFDRTRSTIDSSNEDTQTGPSSTVDKIFFPDTSLNRMSMNVDSLPVPSCQGTTICADPPYYPSAIEVQVVLKKRYLDPVTEPPLISERIGPVDEENGLCMSQEKVIQPKIGLDDRNVWRYILNDDHYVQTVRVELCQMEDRACEIIDNVVLGWKTSCKQKYIYRHIVAIGKNGTESIPFQIPSSCCCHVKFVGNPSVRIGQTRSNPK